MQEPCWVPSLLPLGTWAQGRISLYLNFDLRWAFWLASSHSQESQFLK